MTTNNHIGRRFLFETTHRIQPLLEVSMVTLNTIVELLRSTMLGVWENCAEGRRVALRLVGGHP